MELLATVFAMMYQFGDAFAFWSSSCAGLAVNLRDGWGIINLAHGRSFHQCAAPMSPARPPHCRCCRCRWRICVGALVSGPRGHGGGSARWLRHLYHRPLRLPSSPPGALSLIATQGVLMCGSPCRASARTAGQPRRGEAVPKFVPTAGC